VVDAPAPSLPFPQASSLVWGIYRIPLLELPFGGELAAEVLHPTDWRALSCWAKPGPSPFGPSSAGCSGTRISVPENSVPPVRPTAQSALLLERLVKSSFSPGYRGTWSSPPLSLQSEWTLVFVPGDWGGFSPLRPHEAVPPSLPGLCAATVPSSLRVTSGRSKCPQPLSVHLFSFFSQNSFW